MGTSAGRLAVLTVGLYLLMALPLAWLARFQINEDGIAYIQIARHLARGEFDLSISSWWSPLLSWLLVPFVSATVEPNLAAKLLNIVFGLGFAFGVSALVKELTGGAGSRIALVAGLLLALIMLPDPVSPDLLVTCLLTWYFVQAMKLFRSDSIPRAAGLGLLGGLAYLAKAYALPFAVLHLAMTMMLKLRLLEHSSVRACVKQYVASLVALAVVVLPWVGVISGQDGHLTISSAGEYWSAWSPLPAHKPRPPDRELQLPREGRLLMWENPVETRLPWPVWSPFDGLTGLRYQLMTITQNLGLLRDYLGVADLLGLLPVGFIFAVVFLFPLRDSLHAPGGMLRLWGCVSVMLYVSGYVLALLMERYLWPTWGMLLALTIAGPALSWPRDIEEGQGRAGVRAVTGRTLALWYRLGVCVLVASVAMNVGKTFYEWTGPGGKHAFGATWKRAGEQFAPGCRFVASEHAVGLYVTYWSGGVYLGELTGKTADDVARELAPFGGVTVLVLENTWLGALLSASPKFTRLDTEGPVLRAFGFGGGTCPRTPIPASAS